MVLQFPRPATLQAAEFAAAWPAANFQRSFFLKRFKITGGLIRR
jgi:hypothetical protein